MSTKIYSGYRFSDKNPAGNLAALQRGMAKIRLRIHRQLHTGMRRSHQANLLQHMLAGDPYALAWKKSIISITAGINKQLASGKNPDREYVYTDCWADNTTVVYFPSKTNDRHDLAIIYSRDQKTIGRLLGLHYHGYWNNEEAPKSVTATEWKQRNKDWDFLQVPACQGWSIQAFTPNQFNHIIRDALSSAFQRLGQISTKTRRRCLQDHLQCIRYAETVLAIMAGGGKFEFSFSQFNNEMPTTEEIDAALADPAYAWIQQPLKPSKTR